MIPKFRAWDKELQTMLDVSLIDFKKSVLVGEHWKFGETNFMSFDDIKLMQSTGLFDKNGTEIFEGDVVVTNGRRRQVITFGTQEVEEDFGSVRIYKGFNLYLGGGYPNAVMSTFEVIGNIYENPELMEVSDDQ
jgi:uncharacterized phage protein (TIGR01671 family)